MIARALRDALDESPRDALDPEIRDGLKELLEMFEDYPGDAKADVLARRSSGVTCGNCELTWEGFYLPISVSGRGLQTNIRLAVCPRCYNNQSIFLSPQEFPPASTLPTPPKQENTP